MPETARSFRNSSCANKTGHPEFLMKRLNSEIIGSLFWMLVGICFALGTIKLKVGTPRNIGSGFFPLAMALILILFSGFNLVRGVIRSSRPIERISWKPHLGVVICIFLYGFLLNVIGFLLSTFILMSAFFGLLLKGERKWVKVMLYSSVTALAAWLTFSVVLHVPFPSPRLINFLR
jgi:hypothetical protein